jgi:hypothetical protein
VLRAVLVTLLLAAGLVAALVLLQRRTSNVIAAVAGAAVIKAAVLLWLADREVRLVRADPEQAQLSRQRAVLWRDPIFVTAGLWIGLISAEAVPTTLLFVGLDNASALLIACLARARRRETPLFVWKSALMRAVLVALGVAAGVAVRAVSRSGLAV